MGSHPTPYIFKRYQIFRNVINLFHNPQRIFRLGFFPPSSSYCLFWVFAFLSINFIAVAEDLICIRSNDESSPSHTPDESRDRGGWGCSYPSGIIYRAYYQFGCRPRVAFLLQMRNSKMPSKGMVRSWSSARRESMPQIRLVNTSTEVGWDSPVSQVSCPSRY